MKRQHHKEVQELLVHSSVAATLDNCSDVIPDREEGDNAFEKSLS